MSFSYCGIKLVLAGWELKENHLPCLTKCARHPTRLQNRLFHIFDWTTPAVNVEAMKSARVNCAKLFVLLLNMQICRRHPGADSAYSMLYLIQILWE